MKKLFALSPSDVKQTFASLAVSVSLLTGSLLMLSAYMNSIHGENKSVDVVATVATEEESTSPEV